jgi:hypothetical protein
MRTSKYSEEQIIGFLRPAWTVLHYAGSCLAIARHSRETPPFIPCIARRAFRGASWSDPRCVVDITYVPLMLSHGLR